MADCCHNPLNLQPLPLPNHDGITQETQSPSLSREILKRFQQKNLQKQNHTKGNLQVGNVGWKV
ncbi:hypothetical protein HanIR_Chr12g0570361 [Helianthus annuus]|nr:hypothetical protein HanIR_Chr12g0570361 [Helianthus annuus]